jgi:alpha-mannosidase
MNRSLMHTMTAACMPLLVATTMLAEAGQTSAGQRSAESTLRGYSQSIAGEQIEYNCFNPLATRALLTRCTSGTMAIEWETEAVPRPVGGEYVTFKWIVSYSTMTSAGDRRFDFFINNEKSFVIRTTRGVNQKQWSLEGKDGARLAFELVREDAAGDANGYMILRVPVKDCPPGKPLRLRVVGEKADASDWFMTFMYDLGEYNVEILPMPFLTKAGDALSQTICVGIGYTRGRGSAVLWLEDGKKQERKLVQGSNVIECTIPAVSAPRQVTFSVSVDGKPAEKYSAVARPVMKRTIYLLPHSHNDIGYTDIQTEVLKKQVKNINDALDLIRATASYPPDARFRWNIEVLWAVESFLKEASDTRRREFFDAIREGSLSLEGLYANVLTGIMRPEEFFRLTEYARSFRAKYGVAVTSAMISDVPGMTWNMVPALALAGIRYFSSGPNGSYSGGDRTGHTNSAWGDRPFYWVSPSGQERRLYWMTGYGYGSLFADVSSGGAVGMSFLRNLFRYFEWLDRIGYPYDMIQMRHTCNGDNGTVDPGLPEYVRKWNEKYVSPKIVISTTGALFAAFEAKYGATLPAFGGDLTPYWEDGAASTAYELGVNRTSSERLVQTEVLSAMLDPAHYDQGKFAGAWRNVLLFDEHTWGASSSISEPDSPFATKQWEIKQRFARDGAAGSAALLQAITGVPSAEVSPGVFDVENTDSWERTDLVVLSPSQSAIGDLVRDEEGRDVPSQRLSDGTLAFLAQGVPPLASRRYRVFGGGSLFASDLKISHGTIRDGNLEVSLDTATGCISHLKTIVPSVDYVDTAGGGGLNGFFYVPGLDTREARTSGRPTVTVKERGPLVASFLMTSDAPGCNLLMREVRVVRGMGRVDLINTIDKQKVRTKEAVHFAFPFALRGGVVRIDLGFGVIRPEADQLPGSCKDYYSAQRWVDVSNQEFGVTLTVAEAPLVEVGEMHSELPSPRNVSWKTAQSSSPHIWSYVMNNYWHTNYKADQEGPCTFHYSIIPHGLYNQASATRWGVERSHPLIVRGAGPGEAANVPLIQISPGGIIATSVKPLEGARGVLVRLFNAGGSPQSARLSCRDGRTSVYISSPFREKGEKVNEITLPANGIVTVRVE